MVLFTIKTITNVYPMQQFVITNHLFNTVIFFIILYIYIYFRFQKKIFIILYYQKKFNFKT